MCDRRAKNLSWMSQSFVERAFCNVNHADQALSCVKEHASKHFVIKKLYIAAGPIHRFRIIKDLRTSVLNSLRS